MVQGESGFRFWNWSHTYGCSPELLFRPRNLHELRQILELARRRQKRVKVLGGGHSPSDIACSQDFLIHMGKLNRVLQVDKEKLQVKVEAGILLSELNLELDKHGMALANLGAVAEVTAAGVIGTGTHNTGIGHGILPTQNSPRNSSWNSPRNFSRNSSWISSQNSSWNFPGILPRILPGILPGILLGIFPGILPGIFPGILPGIPPGILSGIPPGIILGFLPRILPGILPGLFLEFFLEFFPEFFPEFFLEFFPEFLQEFFPDFFLEWFPEFFLEWFPEFFPEFFPKFLPEFFPEFPEKPRNFGNFGSGGRNPGISGRNPGWGNSGIGILGDFSRLKSFRDFFLGISLLRVYPGWEFPSRGKIPGKIAIPTFPVPDFSLLFPKIQWENSLESELGIPKFPEIPGVPTSSSWNFGKEFPAGSGGRGWNSQKIPGNIQGKAGLGWDWESLDPIPRNSGIQEAQDPSRGIFMEFGKGNPGIFWDLGFFWDTPGIPSQIPNPSPFSRGVPSIPSLGLDPE